MRLVLAKTPPEEEVIFSLCTKSGDIILQATYKGHDWCLLTFYTNGDVFRHPSLPSDIGFKLTSFGKLDIK